MIVSATCFPTSNTNEILSVILVEPVLAGGRKNERSLQSDAVMSINLVIITYVVDPVDGDNCIILTKKRQRALRSHNPNKNNTLIAFLLKP